MSRNGGGGLPLDRRPRLARHCSRSSGRIRCLKQPICMTARTARA